MTPRAFIFIALTVAVTVLSAGAQQAGNDEFASMLQKVREKIEKSGRDGVGIKSYEQVLNSIEADFKSSQQPESLKKRLDSLSAAIDDQVAKIDAADPTPKDNSPYGDYMRHMQRRIKRCWHAPKNAESYRILSTFTIDRHGAVSNITLLNPYKLPEANSAAIQAIQDAAPFEFLQGSKAKTIKLQFTFSYHRYN